jgi:hypothetical protein
MRRVGTCSAILGLSILQGTSAPSAASAQGAAVEGSTPYLHMSIQGLSPRGGSHGEASVSYPLSTEHTAQVRVNGGSVEASSLGICAAGSGGLEFHKGASIGWLLEGRLIAADATGARVKLRWKRSVIQPAVIDVGDFEREYVIRLEEGIRETLDLVRPIAGTAEDCDGAVVQAWMDFADPPELAGQLFDFEIWLVHREADGREVLDRATGRTLNGQDLKYLFKPLRYDTSGAPRPDGAVEVKLSGSVKARARADGRIELAVGLGRIVSYQSLGSGEGGSKQATMRDGDTLEFELPPHQWSNRYTLSQHSAVRVTVRRVR